MSSSGPPFPEIEAMQVALDALDALTPDERERAIWWLSNRVTSDRRKGILAAGAFADFVRAVERPRRRRRGQVVETR